MHGSTSRRPDDGQPVIAFGVDNVFACLGEPRHRSPHGFEFVDIPVPPGHVQLGKWIKPELGKEVVTLIQAGAHVAWSSTWGEYANERIAPLLGLPPLPVIEFANHNGDPEDEHWMEQGWKFPAVLNYVAGRPLLWFDTRFHAGPLRANYDLFLRLRRFDAVTGDDDKTVFYNTGAGINDLDFLYAHQWLAKF